ncbi:M4 family metallopeptidase [Streptomyces sp. NPDC050504]|uniref:M4 family metallopeptidase n=1 Tax=Streptomyces sp. NPDC050504 TaxID=3365618 RepID=UPI00379D6A14
MTPHKNTRLSAALIASAAMVVTVAVQSTATAAPDTATTPATTAATAQAAAPTGASALPLAASPRAAAIAAAQEQAPSAARTIGLGGKEELVVRDVVKDADGTVHTRYERTFAGLPVLGGDLVTHTAKNGRVKGVDRATDAPISVPTTTVAPTTAAARTTASAAGARKVVWARDGKPVLAYETVKTGTQHDGTPSKLHVVTDAATGKELRRFEAVMTGEGTSQYSGTVTLGTSPGIKKGKRGGFALTDAGRGGHSTYDLKHGQSGKGTLFTDDDDKWGDGTPANAQTAGVDAAYGAALTWDFYKSELQRNGIAGDGRAAYSRVHYGNAYVNAFWDDSCFCMTYGDGEGDKKPLTSIDVAGHEMTHGLTSATANLEYAGESGGLNEATSDIIGSSVEFFANNKEDVGDYLVGEEIDINGDGSPLRYMDQPSKDGQSLDYWDENAGNVDVHYSSGIANHFFYLLAEGSGQKEINGVRYDSPTKDGSEVTGIGREKAYKIWYKALSAYMTSTTDYKAAREATLKAANDLYGADGTEARTVAAAWTAVNVK